MSNSRLFYIDNLRIFLISLVVLLHLNITYGAPGDWYYNESEAGMPEVILQSMFNITNIGNIFSRNRNIRFQDLASVHMNQLPALYDNVCFLLTHRNIHCF